MDNFCNIGLDSNLLSPPARHFCASTVLTRAIACQASRQTGFLLKQGCDPNLPIGTRQMRPLMVACFVGNKHKRTTIIRILLQHGADPSLTDVYGRSCVMYACGLSLKEEVELLIKNSEYNLNMADVFGDTTLHVCAKAGVAEVLGVVLGHMQRYRLDISLQNRSHLTPLSLAILNGHCECARMLHGAGVSPRFSPSTLEYVVSVLCKKPDSAGVRAIADARSVGRAFDVRKGCADAIHRGKAILCKDNNGKMVLPKIRSLPELPIGHKEMLTTCMCSLSSWNRRVEVKLPKIHDVCKLNRWLSFYSFNEQ